MTNRVDTFDRANGALIGSTPSDGGGVWSGNGTWNISSNCGLKSADFNTLQFAWLESSAANVDVSATINVDGNCGLAARVTDANNCIYGRVCLNNCIVYKWEAGTATQLGSTYVGTPTAGDVWVLSVSGDNIVLKQNGTARVTTTSSFNNTATKHGLGDFNITGSWTTFSITEITASGGLPNIAGKQMSGGFPDLSGGTS